MKICFAVGVTHYTYAEGLTTEVDICDIMNNNLPCINYKPMYYRVPTIISKVGTVQRYC